MGPHSQAMTRIGASCLAVAVIAVLASSEPAAAAPRPITGKLSRSGYTVIALAASGRAKAVQATRGQFRLRPPAERVTLHLRAPNGIYAGPIVIGSTKRGTSAVVGVKSGARLGTISVRRGYAKLSRPLRMKWLDTSRTARARKGVPIGAGNFGRVRSPPPRLAIRGDRDLDGVPDPLDIDDDGDLILDTVDRSAVGRAAQAIPPSLAVLSDPFLELQEPPPPTFGVLSTLTLGLPHTTNASVRDSKDPSRPVFEDAQIDAALKSYGGLIFGFAGGPGSGFSELDCAGDPAAVPPRPGLMYCSNGGTGRLSTPPMPGFPECCDPGPGDPPGGDGFGTLPPFLGAPQLLHGATSAEIKTGDLLIERKNNDSGVEIAAFATTLQYVFATVPALASYDDDGPGGKQPAPLTYPYPRDLAHHLPVAPRPPGDPLAGDVVVTLTFWRPQRRRIAGDPEPQPGESATWTDIGSAGYGAGAGGQPCPQSAFSEDDPELVDPPPPPPGSRGPIAGGGGFVDGRQGAERPASTNNKLTYTLNLTQCLRANGAESSFDQPGEVLLFSLVASGRGGRADQGMSFKRI